jgi:hypothetical protein
MNKLQDRKIISIVILAISLLQAVIVAVRYFRSVVNLNNPLIPESLLTGIRNFSITVIAIYVIVALLNIYFLVTKKFFLPVTIVSILTLCAIFYFTADMQSYFINYR